MKKLILGMAALLSTALPAMAADVAYKQQFVNQVVTTTTSFVLDLDAYNIDGISFQATLSSANPQAQTFNDGHISSGTITIVSTSSLVVAQGSATIVVLSTNGLSSAGISINNSVMSNNGWRINFASFTAIDIAAEINGQFNYTASTTGPASVNVRCASSGTFCNSIPLAIVGTSSLTVNSFFSGGQDPAYLIINGRQLTQGNQWSVIGSSVQVSTAIAAAINADSVLSTIMVATANTTCPGCGIVYTTGTILTSASGSFNYLWSTGTTSSPTTGIKLSSSSLTTGTTSAYLLNTATISLPSHGLATGEAVLFSTGTSNTALGGLTWGTTYFVVALDANSVALVRTSTNAFAGSAGYINLTSTSTSGAHNFTLTPAPLSGTAVLSWSQSNDGVTFSTASVTASNVTIGTTTFASPYTAVTNGWDFGGINYRFLKLNVAGPTTAGFGGFNTVVTGYGKRYWR